ncbi:hypothetical protein AVEN_248999-1 [Araneus ventricosus]|uniref:Uncharacterized protein n=1 Tax=Araneus ventricosus TaxID=182803 RepID=A0A4Y2G7C4_ARAVE|nr:hypothetical protein AVEN_248999-1 [Araneus ventricosus]
MRSNKYSYFGTNETVKPAIHFTDKLDILEREKKKAMKIYGNQPIGLYPDSNFSLQQDCHKFVMTRVQACSKLTKASKSPWNELAASLPQPCRANSSQIIAETEYEYNPG